MFLFDPSMILCAYVTKKSELSTGNSPTLSIEAGCNVDAEGTRENVTSDFLKRHHSSHISFAKNHQLE